MEKYRLIQESKVDEPPPTSPTQPQTHQQNTPPGQPYPSGKVTAMERSEYPEVRITQQGKPRNYISYAMNLLSEGSASASSSGSKTIVLKAMGRAINKAVTIAEILKRKMPLHQWNVLSSLEMIDLYEPIEEGLDVVENRRYVSCLTITLSLTLLQHSEGMAKTDDDSPPLDTHHFGYQPPLPLAELQQSNLVSYSNYSNIPQPQRHQQ